MSQYSNGYRDGLKRAQELLKALIPRQPCDPCEGLGKRYAHPNKGGHQYECPDCEGSGSVIPDLEAFDQAIEIELSKPLDVTDVAKTLVEP